MYEFLTVCGHFDSHLLLVDNQDNVDMFRDSLVKKIYHMFEEFRVAVNSTKIINYKVIQEQYVPHSAPSIIRYDSLMVDLINRPDGMHFIRFFILLAQELYSEPIRALLSDCTLSLYRTPPAYMKNLADIFLKSLSSRLYPRTRQLLLHIFGEIAIHMPLSIMMYFQTLINECIKDLKNSDV